VNIKFDTSGDPCDVRVVSVRVVSYCSVTLVTDVLYKSSLNLNKMNPNLQALPLVLVA
jgi:hypothetical protein